MDANILGKASQTMRKKAIAEQVSNDITPEGWTYRWNDQTMTQDEYQRLVLEHRTWVEEQERQVKVSATETPKKRSKNT